jgi:formate transporter
MRAAVAKAKLHWPEMAVKSLPGGKFGAPKNFMRERFILMAIRCVRWHGWLLHIIVAGGVVGLCESNPSIATLLGALVFCLGFVLITITNTELVHAEKFVMIYTTL